MYQELGKLGISHQCVQLASSSCKGETSVAIKKYLQYLFINFAQSALLILSILSKREGLPFTTKKWVIVKEVSQCFGVLSIVTNQIQSIQETMLDYMLAQFIPKQSAQENDIVQAIIKKSYEAQRQFLITSKGCGC